MKKKADSNKALTRILLTALPDVPFDGWTEDLLSRTAQKLTLSEKDMHKHFPDGVINLVCYFSTWADDAMLAKLPQKSWDKMRIRDRITTGVQTRLDILAPYKQAVSSSLSFLAPPPRNLFLPKMVWRTADVLWRKAGDTATDYNYYTKRILLSGVITSTTLYWLNDDSDNHEKTRDFLDRRIDNVLKIGQKIGKFKNRQEKRA